MKEHAASRMGARLAAGAGAVIAFVGLLLLFGGHPDGGGLAGIGTAVQTVVGGVLLVAAALVGVASAVLFLIAARRRRRDRARRHWIEI